MSAQQMYYAQMLLSLSEKDGAHLGFKVPPLMEAAITAVQSETESFVSKPKALCMIVSRAMEAGLIPGFGDKPTDK